MPVNMTPRKDPDDPKQEVPPEGESEEQATTKPTDRAFGEPTEADREADLAEAEWKNLWDATEVIDMDTW